MMRRNIKKNIKILVVIGVSILVLNYYFLVVARPIDEFRVEINQKTVNQGDVVLIKIYGPDISDDNIKATFNNKGIKLFSNNPNQIIGLIGIDMLLPPGSYPLLIKDGLNKIFETEIEVSKLAILKEVEDNPLVLPPVETKLIEKTNNEAKLLNRAFLTSNPAPFFNKNFSNPIKNLTVTGSFGYPRIYLNTVTRHRGIDLRIQENEKVKAINRGKVILAEELTLGGGIIIIDHGSNIFSIYAHLNKLLVDKGKIVEKGEALGMAGESGLWSLGRHLHLGIRIGNAAVNPTNLLELKIFDDPISRLINSYAKLLQHILR